VSFTNNITNTIMYVDIHGPSRETNNILYHLKNKTLALL